MNGLGRKASLGFLSLALVAGCGGDAGMPSSDVGERGGRGAGGAPVSTGGGTDAGSPAADGGMADAISPANPAPAPYVAQDRTIVSGGVERTFVLARQDKLTAGLPVVFALHGDGGDGRSFRAALGLEAVASRQTVFVYPSAPGGTFEYYTASGRQREAQFVRDVIVLLAGELGVDTTRVFMTGMSGGATMTNGLLCHLPAGVIRAVGIHSGTLYAADGDFQFTAKGGVTCPLPPALFVWGEQDRSDVSFSAGESTRDNYRANFGCEAAPATPWTRTPCVTFTGCSAPVVWCPVAGLAHALWSGAAPLIESFFDGF